MENELTESPAEEAAEHSEQSAQEQAEHGELAALRADVTALQQAVTEIQTMLKAEALATLITATAEMQEEDIQPQSQSFWYRPMRRRE